jgi:NADH dehydrogenase [ubiquinone] 1 alpha subcomplex assembly factor 1
VLCADGARWQAVNDPVMGGISVSGFKVEGNRGVWSGEVKVVPRLHAPGFCRVNGALSAGPVDLSQSAGLIFDVSGTGDPVKTMLAQIETGHSDFRGQFVANVTGISAETGSHFVAFSDFRPFGIRPEAGGPPTMDQLKHVTQVGMLADGTKGRFKIELGEVLAGSSTPSPAPAPAPGVGGLSLFEFSNSSKPWRVTDDPVMGGVSHSAFKVIDGVGVWVGEVKTVPKLQAPGTCQANSATFASADASSYDAIEIKLISKGELKQFQSVS